MARGHDVALDALSLFSNLPWVISKATLCLSIPHDYFDKYCKLWMCAICGMTCHYRFLFLLVHNSYILHGCDCSNIRNMPIYYMSPHGKLVNSKNKFNIVMIIIILYMYIIINNIHHVILKIVQYVMMIKYCNNSCRL